MKKPFVIISLIFAFIMTGCLSYGSRIPKPNSEKFGDKIRTEDTMKTLDSYLNRLTGVSVYGSGANAKVLLRGSVSFEQDTTPLFVINGIRVGRKFSDVYHLVTMNDLVSIKILRMPKATNLYGYEGVYGAIEITTKTDLSEVLVAI